MEYTNQYIGLTKDAKLRTTFEICLKDVAKLRAYDPKEGTLQTTASILFKKLIHELEQSKLEHGDFSAFHYAISHCHIVLGYGSEQTVSIGGIRYQRIEDEHIVQRSTAAVAGTGEVDTSAVKAVKGDVGHRTAKLARKTKGA